MNRRIPDSIRDEIHRAAYGGSRSIRELAVRFGMARATIAAIVREGRSGPQPKMTAIDFRPVKPYHCDECENWTDTNPCPVCAALEARELGVKSAISGMRAGVNGGQENKNKSAAPARKRSQTLWVEIPAPVAIWIRQRLKRMIDRDGHVEEVAEAIENLSDQVTALIAATANTIGEDRRQKALAKAIHTGQTTHFSGSIALLRRSKK